MSSIDFDVFNYQLDRARHAPTAEQQMSAFIKLDEMVTPENVLSRDEANEDGVIAHISGGCENDHEIDGILILMFLARGASLELDVSKIHHYTPLHFAAWYGKSSVIKLLLDVGVPRDILDAKKHTALYWASCKANNECCNVLVDAGAQLMTKHRHHSVMYNSDFLRSRECARVASCVILALKRCKSNVLRNSGNGNNVLLVIARCVWQTRGQEKEWIRVAASASPKIKKLKKLKK